MPTLHKVKNEKGEIMKAGCVVINDSREILLVTTKEKKDWAFPKGHVEIGETIEQTAIREVKEETGYIVELIERRSDLTYSNKETGETIRVAIFEAKPVGEQEEHEPGIISDWFSIQNARDALAPNLVFIVDEIDSLTLIENKKYQ